MQAHDQASRGTGATSHNPGQLQPHPGPAQHAVQRTGRRLKIAVGAVIGFLAVAYAGTQAVRHHESHQLAKSAAEAAAAPPLVKVFTIGKVAPARPLVLPGETAAWYQSSIYSRVDGYVATWMVDLGDRVRKGQVLATIDTPELDAQLTAAKARFAASLSQIKVWEAKVAFANSTYARWRDAPKGVVSEQEREDKQAGYKTAVAELASAQAKSKLDEADVDRLEAFEQFKRVVAPYSGVIIQRRIDIGDLVNAGSSANTHPLYRMSKDDPIRVFVDVPQGAAPDLMKNGVSAQIAVAGRADPIEGRITRTSEAIDPRSRTFRAELDIPNPDGSLVPGLYVKVGFQLPSKGYLEVPAAALLFRPSGPAVAVVAADGIVHFSPVAIGRDDGNVVELSSGVAPGERVVLNLSAQVTEGSKVRVINPGRAGADDQPVK